MLSVNFFESFLKTLTAIDLSISHHKKYASQNWNTVALYFVL